MGAPTEGPRLGPVGAHPVERSTTRSLAGSVLENSEDHYIRLTGRRLCTIGHPHAPKLCGIAFIACRRGALASGQIPSCQTRIPLISKLYRQMYANTGIATDSARMARSTRWARWLARPCRRLFVTAPMPHLHVPTS